MNNRTAFHRDPAEHARREAEWAAITDPDAFWAKVHRTNDAGCWQWLGGTTAEGYGRHHVRRDGQAKTWAAHRLAYTLAVGPIPAGLTIDHLCRVRHCVNPSHLEPVTVRENTARGTTWLWEKSKTHCPRGHAYEGDNLRVNDKGYRDCRACDREDARRRRAEAAALRPPKPTTCKVEGCDADRYRSGLCVQHHGLRERYGSEYATPRPRPEAEHGSISRYRGTPSRPGCRCEPCRDAQRQHLKRYRKPAAA